MKPVSIFNDVLGPIMRGPSSSHTAGPYHIGVLARGLLGEEPAAVTFVFDPRGSFAEVYRQQGSDLGFAAGVMGLPLTSDEFPQTLQLAEKQGLQIKFAVEALIAADHPNAVDIRMIARTRRQLNLSARSIGGGAIVLNRLNEWPVHITGDAYELLIETTTDSPSAILNLVSGDEMLLGLPEVRSGKNRNLIAVHRKAPMDAAYLDQIRCMSGITEIWTASPIFYVPVGKPLFTGAVEMLAMAEERNCSMGQAALDYESELLGLSPEEILAETLRRYEIMAAAAKAGLKDNPPSMALLRPSAGKIFAADAQGRLAIGGLHTRAAARAMAVMHINSGQGVVCAAPTAGAAGVIPGVLLTLEAEKSLSRKQIALGLLAASAVGLVIAARATFAAEVAGCQVEIGAAGAMAAAAVVEFAGGSARQAADAAAIALQNTMGSICDPVQALVEIPCHTRNAVAASSAFVCADLILGGYQNLIPLDETIDVMYAVGRMLPRELKCTALGGLSTAPSALKRKTHAFPAG